MVAGLVAARRALQVPSDRPPVFFSRCAPATIRSVPIRTVARPATRLRKRSSRVSSNSSSGMPTRSGGTIACDAPEIDLDELGDSYIRDLRAQFAAMGRGLWVLDVTSDLGIPVVIAVAHWTEDARECIEFAAGAHFDLRIATLRAVTELNQLLAIDRMRRASRRPTGRRRTMRCRCRCARHAYRAAARQGARPARAVSEICKPRSARAGAGLRQARQASSGSISSSSTRPARTSRFRSSG